MPLFNRPLLIWNPTAGVCWSSVAIRKAIRELKEWFPLIEIATTHAPGHATRLAKEAARTGHDLIIVAGGDGTVNEVINGITGTETVLACLPTGTGNSIARELGLPLHPVKAAKAMRHGEVREACLGEADGRLFILMVGIGFDGYAVKEVSYRLKRILGRMSYVVSGSIALFRYAYPSFTVMADGKPFTATTAIIAKSKYYASCFKIASHVSLEEPAFELCVFAGRGFWRYLIYVGAVVLNIHHRLSDVVLVKAREVQIQEVLELPAQMDGEVLSFLPMSFRIAERRIKILFPKKPLC